MGQVNQPLHQVPGVRAMRKPEVTIAGRRWNDDKNQAHRWAGPAIELDNGFKIWYWHGFAFGSSFPHCSYYSLSGHKTQPHEHAGPIVLKNHGYEQP